jgi:hypothetical protein
MNIYSQSTNSFILKNLYQAKHEKHMTKNKMNMWLTHNQDKIDQVLLLSMNIYGSNLIIRRNFLRMSLYKT